MVLFTGVGPSKDGKFAFCSGGDQTIRGSGGYLGEDGVPRLNAVSYTHLTLPTIYSV